MKASNILIHELIGLEVKVIYSPNIYEVGVEGKVILETRNCLIIGKEDRRVMIAKSARLFLFKVDDGSSVLVLGDRLIGRPEERVKKA
ncbi:MAG: ribonuclease P protein subunit [Candidatus Korarchaeum sp.]|nr:ribonuclease P protein subunit [Candidatus Korarchaeum sp.]MDW8036371.1 ribonuclease P protein subunit [Candidatus Korarchaeum sp.]